MYYVYLYYSLSSLQTLIVTGGYLAGSYLSSVELYDYSLGTEGQWREGTPLPSPRGGPRGSMVGGVFHVTGGGGFNDGDYLDDILSWDPVTESWALAGKMAVARWLHAVTEVPVNSIAEFCIKTP